MALVGCPDVSHDLVDLNGATAEEVGAPTQSRDGALGLFAAATALLVPVAFSPTVFASFWTPKAALVLVIGGVGVPYLMALARRRDLSAVAYLGFLLVAALSAVVAERPLLAVFGLYNHGVGLIFYAAIGAAWAVGVHLDDGARRRVLHAALAAVTLNAVIAVLQTVFDLSELQLPLRTGRAEGLLGNPVHLGALCAAGAGAALHLWCRATQRWAYLAVAIVCLIGLQLSASRLALVVIVVVVAALVLFLRPRMWWVLPLVLLVALGTGEVVARSSSVPSGTSRTLAPATGGDTGSRLEMWKAGAKAVVDSPIVGSGPGQFRAATARYRTPAAARAEGADRLLIDAHNVAVEMAVTVGPVGLIALALFGVSAIRRSAGPASTFALAGLSLTLLQPITVMTVPVCMLVLGASERSSAPRHALGRWRAVVPVAGSVGLALGIVLLIADSARLTAELDFTIDDANRSEELLPPWSEPASMLGKLNLFQSIIRDPDNPEFAHRAVAWREEAARRDPTDPALWIDLGELKLSLTDVSGAKNAFMRALAANPQSSAANVGLGEVASTEGNHKAAIVHYQAALANETTASNRAFLERRIERAEQAIQSD